MFIAPEQLLNKPQALCSPDLKFLINVIEDTYVNHICSTHPEVSSPCDCGEPLNKTLKGLLQDKPFDPLQLDNQQSGKMKTLSFMVATIILSLALTESVSESGVYLNINE